MPLLPPPPNGEPQTSIWNHCIVSKPAVSAIKIRVLKKSLIRKIANTEDTIRRGIKHIFQNQPFLFLSLSVCPDISLSVIYSDIYQFVYDRSIKKSIIHDLMDQRVFRRPLK